MDLQLGHVYQERWTHQGRIKIEIHLIHYLVRENITKQTRSETLIEYSGFNTSSTQSTALVGIMSTDKYLSSFTTLFALTNMMPTTPKLQLK